MRKFLMAVAIGGLVLLVAAPAMALDFKFGAEYRVRFYDYMNDGFDKDNTLAVQGAGNTNTSTNGIQRGNPRGVQIRVRPMFDVSDDNGNIQAKIRFEYGDTDFGSGGGNWSYSWGSNQTNIKPGLGSTTRTGNNAGGGLGADGVGLETKWAYIDFAMPAGLPMRVRAGIQGFYLPKGMVIDDDAAGVRAYGNYGIFSYDLWWILAARGTADTAGTTGVMCAVPAGGLVAGSKAVTFVASNVAACTAAGGVATATTALTAVLAANADTTRDSSYTVWLARGDLNIAPWLQPGAYFAFVDNRVNCSEPNVSMGYVVGGVLQNGSNTCPDRNRNQYYFGLTATGKLGTVDYDADFVYGSAKGGNNGSYGTGGINTTGAIGSPVTVQGFALDGGVHIPIGPVKLNLLGSYASGDNQSGGNSKAYPGGISPSWSGAGGQYELIGEGGAFDVVSMTQHAITNLWMLGATLEYVPVKALWLKAAYGFVGFANKYGNCATAETVSPGSATTIAGTLVQIPGTQCYGPTYYGKPSDPIAGHSTLGQELHFRADYTMWTGFKVQAMAGWLFPSSGDIAGKYILQFLYNF